MIKLHSGSLLWLCIRLHDTSTKSHTRASHTGASSPRFLYRSEIFTPVRKLVPMSCKRGTTVRSGMKSLSRESGTGSACVCLFNHSSADIKCLFLQPWNEISSLHVNTVWNHNVIPVWNSHRCEFSHVNTPLDKRTETRSSFRRCSLFLNKTFIVFFVVYFTAILVRWILMYTMAVSTHGLIIHAWK